MRISFTQPEFNEEECYFDIKLYDEQDSFSRVNDVLIGFLNCVEDMNNFERMWNEFNSNPL
eukprot:CAMPEP_0116968400 /NCGR_PEP_ID=MMETSP0467-20121206/51204_1 /TAXON_ID=283647 /ORGANISM="Mesodinium pulex, Strain SPMC105" /LENGTH=60 /DNA_ID=CAMNT_0004658653 /DNA_START=272 /DNA_END=450 /DNA_ORIENTATION=-